MQLILEIILGQEIRLDGLPQTEKETRNSPLYRHIRLDVWARDLDSRVYDTEVQSRNTGNLPRRSRYYQGQIDTKLLKPGTVDFNLLSDIVLILIAPFDLIGEGRYRYTFQMCCLETGRPSSQTARCGFSSIPTGRIRRTSARNWRSCFISWSTPTIPLTPGRMREGAAAAQED